MTEQDTLESTQDETTAEASAIEPSALEPSALELSGRDRFAVRLIDAALKFGSREFRQRYRPVTEEFFSHHAIDPTAKPAYVPPTRDPIAVALESGDPLEVVRSSISAVIVDRQARDDARIRAEEELAVVAAELAVMTATAADLDLRLAAQTSRASTAEAEVARLAALLHSETVSLNARRESEVKAAEERRVSEVTELTTRRDADVESLTTKHELEVQALTAQRVAEVAALDHQREIEVSTLTAQRKTDIATLHEQRESVLAAQNIEHENAIAALSGELALAKAENLAQVAALTEQLVVQESTLTAAKDDELAAAQSAHAAELDRLHTESARVLTEVTAERDGLVATLDGHIGESSDKIALLVQIATEERCAEDETDDYAIGANDVAVRILDAIEGVGLIEDDEPDSDAPDSDSDEPAAVEHEGSPVREG